MKLERKPGSPDHGTRSGFALITTLMIMALIVLLVMALLSMSSINQRQATSYVAEAEAKANADLAMSIAISELQRLTGPDTRITAPGTTLRPASSDADVVSPAGVGVTGVWRSWENGDFLDSTVPPIAPNYAMKESVGTTSSPITSGRFLGWLQSTSIKRITGKREVKPTTDHRPSDNLSTMVAKTASSVPILSKGTLETLATDKTEVHIEPIDVVSAHRSGAMAWWVNGENTKAHVATPDTDRANVPPAESIFAYRDAMAAHGMPDVKTLGLTYNTSQVKDSPKLVNRDTLTVASTYTVDPTSKFYDLTTSGRGLLTNASKGGWKKDISLLANYNFDGAEDWPPYNPKDKDNSWIYPWATLRNPGESMWRQVGPCLSWRALADYVNHYKEVKSATAAGHITYDPSCGDIGNTTYSEQFLHNVNRMPVLADMRFVMSYSTKLVPGSNPQMYEAYMVLNPVVTLWNPYNFEISLRDMRVDYNNLPIIYDWVINGVTHQTAFYTMVKTVDGEKGLILHIKDGGATNVIRLLPGETRVYSPQNATFVDGASTRSMQVVPGYRTFGGLRFPIINKTTNTVVTAPATAKFKLQRMFTADTNWKYGEGQSEIGETAGVYYDINATLRIGSSDISGMWTSAHRMQYDPVTAEKYFKPLTGMPEISMSDAEGTANKVFASSTLTFRTMNDTAFPVRGMTQMIPTSLYTELGRKGGYDISHPSNGVYLGSQHPVNSPYELLYFAHSGWNDSLLPNVTSKNQGFTVTGIAANNGLSRCVLHELPVRPMVSLGELQNFQLRGQNSFAPYRAFIAGNSTAYPLVPPDKTETVRPNPPANLYRMQFDDSYCFNRMLFDDYFLSSVSEDPAGWNGGLSIKRNVDRVYRDFLNYYYSNDAAVRKISKPLPNISYRPAPLTMSVDEAVTRHLSKADGWSTIASRLVVDGMFNINSTSVEAWKAVLSHGRGLSVPISQTSANALGQLRTTVTLEAGSPSNSPFPRGTVGSDKTGLAQYQAFGGYSRMTDVQIEALAVAIVKQIRKRGPALSLSEFVNRQLRASSDPKLELALAGPIQAALDELATYNDARNPYRDLQALCRKITASEVPPDAEYQFPKAAEGWSGEGMPGWITQADVLRAIAPVLSPRDDTFVVRTFGEARNRAGKATARVWCEAIVQRQAEYVSPAPSLDPASDKNLEAISHSTINSRFGRRYKVVSMRYLTPSEI